MKAYNEIIIWTVFLQVHYFFAIESKHEAKTEKNKLLITVMSHTIIYKY